MVKNTQKYDYVICERSHMVSSLKNGQNDGCDYPILYKGFLIKVVVSKVVYYSGLKKDITKSIVT